jgi:putative component of toxin-antitoxin plasmid stabilization module
MNYRLIKIDQLSGSEASIYTIYLEDKQVSLMDQFLKENKYLFKSELKSIFERLKSIGHDTGAREQYFKSDEGIPGDGVCALYDDPDQSLRLYCIRYGSLIVILGGGGFKPKEIKAFQEDKKLKEENYFLRQVSIDIMQRITDRTITYSNDFMDFEGDLAFNDEDDE